MPSPIDVSAQSASRFVLGTAGHIDHGKTALIRALTGTDTDRLPEEKERGITIELGFAALELDGDLRMSVVDVPGHERLVRTMVSGATGIDVLLLVVAADEGVMPQTREHVAICDLLGIDQGVVALSKVDLVDEEMRELATSDVRDLLAGTPLSGSPIVPVSSTTGEGLPEIRTALKNAVRDAKPRTDRRGPARLGIDRVFAMRGFGTVVTGTLIGGALEVGEKVVILPSGTEAKIRGLQSHAHDTTRIEPGVRCAVNLQGVETHDLARGEILAHANTLACTQTADVEVRWLDSAPVADDAIAIEFLSGTLKRRARLAAIGESTIAPGQEQFARVHIEGDPVALLPGDRFIVRGFARTVGTGGTLGGGVVLDIAPPRRRRTDAALARELGLFRSGDTKAPVRERVLRMGFEGVLRAALQKETGLDTETLEARLAKLADEGSIVKVGPRLLSEKALSQMESMARSALAAFHQEQPLRPGMPRAALLGTLPQNVAPEVGARVLERLEAEGALETDSDLVRQAGFSPKLDPKTRKTVEKILTDSAAAGLEPPALREWAESLGVSQNELRDLLAHLERNAKLVRAPGDLWFDRLAVEALEQRVTQHLLEHGEIDTPSYKALIGTTRRTAVPLMELFDDRQLTRRRGNVRVPFRSDKGPNSTPHPGS